MATGGAGDTGPERHRVARSHAEHGSGGLPVAHQGESAVGVDDQSERRPDRPRRRRAPAGPDGRGHPTNLELGPRVPPRPRRRGPPRAGRCRTGPPTAPRSRPRRGTPRAGGRRDARDRRGRRRPRALSPARPATVGPRPGRRRRDRRTSRPWSAADERRRPTDRHGASDAPEDLRGPDEQAVVRAHEMTRALVIAAGCRRARWHAARSPRRGRPRPATTPGPRCGTARTSASAPALTSNGATSWVRSMIGAPGA